MKKSTLQFKTFSIKKYSIKNTVSPQFLLFAAGLALIVFIVSILLLLDFAEQHQAADQVVYTVLDDSQRRLRTWRM